jgi:hypothetical protein
MSNLSLFKHKEATENPALLITKKALKKRVRKLIKSIKFINNERQEVRSKRVFKCKSTFST